MKRLISILLCVVMLAGLTTFCVEADSEWQDSGIDYTESLDTIDRNPGRGKSGGAWKILGKEEMPTNFTGGGIYTPKIDIGQFSGGNDHTANGHPQISEYPDRIGGVDRLIDEESLADLEKMFAAAEAQGVQLIPRFAYTWSDCTGAEPSDFKFIIFHIEQIAELINKYKETVISVECGILGPWGEMHSSKYNTRDYEKQVLNAWLDNLDETVTLQVRAAGFILNYIHTHNIKFMKELPLTKESTPMYRVGMYNDGYLGTGTDYGTWSGGNNLTRAEGITFLKEQNTRIPYGGEMAYCGIDYVTGVEGNSPSTIYNDDFVQELYYTHLSYLDNIVSNGHTIVEELKKLTFEKRHDFDGMPDVSAYYGQSMQKFMYDHMGYRYVIRSARNIASVGKGGLVEFKGEIENTGFGNLLAEMTSELLIVNGDNEPVIVSSAIDPQEWKTAETTEYGISLSVPKDAEAGEYKVYLRMGTLGYEEADIGAASIRIANDDIWNDALGANYIGSFTVTDEVEGYASQFAEINLDFDDVVADSWYEEAVRQICTMGLMNGTSASTFAPNTTTTRGQFVTVLYNLEGKPSVKGQYTPFNDVGAGRYYANPITWAYNNDIVNGTADTTFSPDEKITREQFATMLYRYAQYKGVDVTARADLGGYTDADSVSNYAKETMSWANAKGFITGMTATTLAPKGNATRAQMATILMRYVADVNK